MDRVPEMFDSEPGTRLSLVSSVLLLITAGVIVVSGAAFLSRSLHPSPVVDEQRLARSEQILRAVQPDLAALGVPEGATDRGVRFEPGCRAGDSAPVGPSVRRTWTVSKSDRALPALVEAAAGLQARGWRLDGEPEPPYVATKVLNGVKVRAELSAQPFTEDGVDSERDVLVFVTVDGPDGCGDAPTERRTAPARPPGDR
jgi:hypothetical protein